MIAEFGLAALWMAAALALLQLISGIQSFQEKGERMSAIVRPAAIMQGAMAAISFAALLWMFARTDLSVKLVVLNSHSAKPMIYKISGAWGNHEGSMLLWVTVMALAGALVAAVEKRLPERTMLATLGAQAFVTLGFYAFLLFSSNPFERLPEPVREGMGLNPLLQDIGLSMHPPTLYAGYVGLSVAFSFAVGAMLTHQVTPRFASVMRPWVLGAWIFLTLGITAGSYWAYYELGWGGWWFWDPVENASLMPWLAATALLHSVSVLAARDALRAWTLMLGVVAFSMSMLGTFLVRSGILTSVHAFAVDPQRGTFILALLVLYIGGALTLFAMRAGTIAEGERFAISSREGALVVNNVAMSAILAVVLFGTLYPLLAEIMGEQVSVGPPYFNPISAIFFLPMLIVMAAGPLLHWRHDQLRRIAGPIGLFGGLIVLVIGLSYALGGRGLLPLLGLGFAVGLGVVSVLPLHGRNLKRVPLPIWGMVLGHLGLALALFGVAADSTFTVERLIAMKAGQQTEVGPWRVQLDGVEPVAGPNWIAFEGSLKLSYHQGKMQQAHPQLRHFWAPVQQTSEAALLTRWNGQLYAVLGEASDDGRWLVRLWWKPFVTLIWFGGLLIALGGMLALGGHLVGDRRRRRAQAERSADGLQHSEGAQ